MKRWLIIGMAVLVAAIYMETDIMIKIKGENDRLRSNQTSLLDSIKFYRTDIGRYAVSVQALELKKSELEKSNLDLEREIKNLNVKIKRVESAAISSTKTEICFHTIVKDSVVYRDRLVADTIKRLHWHDPWVTFNGQLYKDSLTASIGSVDTITQVVHRIPKRFLFFRYGTKSIRQEIVSHNPHTRITYSQYLIIK